MTTANKYIINKEIGIHKDKNREYCPSCKGYVVVKWGYTHKKYCFVCNEVL